MRKYIVENDWVKKSKVEKNIGELEKNIIWDRSKQGKIG